MRRFLPFLAPVLGVAVFLGGAALGDDRDADPTPALAPVDQPVEAARAADPDLDVEAADEPQVAGVPAALVPLAGDPGGQAGAAVAFDPDTGIGSGHEVPPFVPRGWDAAAAEDDPDTTGTTTAADGEADATETTASDAGPTETTTVDADDGGGFPWLLPAGFFLRFLDPCAAADADPEACPEGTGGTILAPVSDDAPPLPPLEIARQVYDHIGVRDLARCPLGANPDGSLSAMLSTNIPIAEMHLEVEEDDGTPVTEVTVGPSSDAERDLFLARLLSGDHIGPDPAAGVLSCFQLEGLTRGAFYNVQVRAVDDLGNVATKTSRIYGAGLVANPDAGGSLPSRTGRPPISLMHSSERARLTVPIEDGREFAWVAVLERNGDDATADTCTSIENDVLDARHRGYSGLIPRGATPLAHSPGGRFDLRFDKVEVFDLFAEEGADLEVCVWITTDRQRSFDLPPVVQRKRFEVQGPRHLRTAVHLVRARLDERVAAGDITIEAADWPARRSADLPALRAGYTIAEPGTVLLDSGGQTHPDATRLRITGPSGRYADVVVPTPNACSTDCEAWRTLDLKVPGPEYVARLCGGGCGEPPPGTYAGELTVSIRSYPGPNGSPSHPDQLGRWSVDDGGAFAAAGRRELPAQPQIDWLSSTATSSTPTPGARPEIRLRLTFDRPVDVEAGMAMDPDHACWQAPQRSAARLATHTFVWSGACFGQQYTFDVFATAADGAVLDLRSMVDGEPTGRAALFAASVPGFPVTSYDYDLSFMPDEPLHLDRVDLIVNGHRRSLIAGGGDTLGGCPSRPLAFSRSMAAVANEGGRPIRWSDPVVVRLEVRGRTCAGETLALDLMVQPTLAQAFAGPFTLSGSGAAGTGEVTITARPATPLVEG